MTAMKLPIVNSTTAFSPKGVVCLPEHQKYKEVYQKIKGLSERASEDLKANKGRANFCMINERLDKAAVALVEQAENTFLRKFDSVLDLVATLADSVNLIGPDVSNEDDSTRVVALLSNASESIPHGGKLKLDCIVPKPRVVEVNTSAELRERLLQTFVTSIPIIRGAVSKLDFADDATVDFLKIIKSPTPDMLRFKGWGRFNHALQKRASDYLETGLRESISIGVAAPLAAALRSKAALTDIPILPQELSLDAVGPFLEDFLKFSSIMGPETETTASTAEIAPVPPTEATPSATAVTAPALQPGATPAATAATAATAPAPPTHATPAAPTATAAMAPKPPTDATPAAPTATAATAPTTPTDATAASTAATAATAATLKTGEALIRVCVDDPNVTASVCHLCITPSVVTLITSAVARTTGKESSEYLSSLSEIAASTMKASQRVSEIKEHVPEASAVDTVDHYLLECQKHCNVVADHIITEVDTHVRRRGEQHHRAEPIQNQMFSHVPYGQLVLK